MTLNEIILGAGIAGLIGLITSILHTLVTEKRELKKIKTCLKNEMHHIIYLIDRKQIDFKSFLGEGDINRNRSKDEWDAILHQFDFKRPYIAMSLVDAIYSNNNVFKLSDGQLTIMQNIQVLIKKHNRVYA